MSQHMPARTTAVVTPTVRPASADKGLRIPTGTEQLTPASDKHVQAWQKAVRHLEAGEYNRAVDLLNHAGQSPDVLNVKGICQMRLGAFISAVATYRSYVLDPGSAMVRTVLPPEHIINFSTALLLTGHPAGCLDVLASVNNCGHPAVQDLKQAITQWASGLSWWQKLNWRFGRIEPAVCQVPISFVPGVLHPSRLSG